MTVNVSGELFDEGGNLLTNMTCSIVAVDQLIGQNGGGRVERGVVAVTDGSGVLDVDLEPGAHILYVNPTANDSTSITVRRQANLTVLTGETSMTLQEALDTDVGEVTSSILQQAEQAATDAIAAKDDAEAAAALFPTISGDAFIQADAGGTTWEARTPVEVRTALGLSDTDSPTFAGANLTDDLTIPDKIIHAGNANTAIRFPAAGTVTVETAGAERLRVDSSGDVGIGTDSPSKTLDVLGQFQVQGGAAGIFLDRSTGQPFIQFLDDGSLLAEIRTLSDGSLLFKAGGSSERLRINPDGDVGIGTTSPDSELDVNGAITQRPLSADPADPADGFSVQWVSDGTGSGDAGDVMMKINVGGTVKTTTLVDYSTL